ncbi:DUF262 domain-containing HNH endonuclease family protein, partial [Candidatus Bathyarchaeota archaeon]|nr:DUF262 domain-containing HNH endonuclease family protein [Candidatus Bathyarchaeota archaeon]
QKTKLDSVNINDLIFSEKYGEKSYNLQIDDRKDCVDALYNGKTYDATGKGESVRNILERYNDIEELFPLELTDKALPYFVDWLINNVVFVEIITYSDDDAYTIFETMNDRGLNLTQTEMLKGYLLSNVDTDQQKNELNDLWKKNIQKLNERYPNTDLEFFKAWLRAKFAETARQRRKGAENEDFEKIGVQFHSWVRDHKDRIGLKVKKDFYGFVKDDFNFFMDKYLRIQNAEDNLTLGLEHIYYIGTRGFTLHYPLLLAPVKMSDDLETIQKKMALVARYLEIYIVCRSLNYKTLGYDSIRYSMFSLIKEIRNKDLPDLVQILKEKVENSGEKLEGIRQFEFSSYYRRFVHFLLARITHHIEQRSGIASNFEAYVNTTSSAPFEIEHIISDNFDLHRTEFNDKEEFQRFRSRMGNLILLQNGFNQSYGQLPYLEKLPHYFSQNLLARTLNPLCYEKNPNFINYMTSSAIPFKAHSQFSKQDIIDRTNLYLRICEEIWSPEGFDIIANT